MLVLVLGPNGSGKSALAEELLTANVGPAWYLATLPAVEMFRQKIEIHRARRPAQWRTVELSGLPYIDERLLAPVTNSKDPMLLDGLSIYLHRLADVDRTMTELPAWLTTLLMDGERVRICVDVPGDVGGGPFATSLISSAQAVLRAGADEIVDVTHRTSISRSRIDSLVDLIREESL